MESLHQDDDKRALRRSLRRQRQALSQHEQRLAAQRLCQQLKTLPEIRRARRISLYLPVNGEIDPMPLLPGCASVRSRFIYLSYDHLALMRSGLSLITQALQW